MDIRDETAVSKRKLKIISLSIQSDDADHGVPLKKIRSYKKSSKANEVLQPTQSPNTKSSVRRIPKEVVKEKGPVKPKAAPVKPKPAGKQSVGKRKRSVNDVVSDVLNDLNDSNVVKRKKSVGEDDVVGSDENVVTDERDDGDQVQDSNKYVESNKDEESNEAEESDEDYEANQTEEESNKDEQSNKDEESNEAEESDQQLVNNVITKTVKGKTTKGKKKDVTSNSESKDEMVKKRGKKTNVILKSKKREHVKGKKKDVVSESDSESKAEMVKKRGKKTKVALKSKKRDHVSEDNVLKVKKKLKKKKKQVYDSSSSFEEEKPIMKKKKLDAKKKKKKPMTLTQIKKEKYLSGFQPLCSRTIPCSLFAAIHDSQVDMKSILSNIGFSLFAAIPYRLVFQGVPLGGTSIFDLLERPLDDDFVKMWFNQFNPKPLKDIRATDISEKLVLSKKVDFICLKQSAVPNTINGFYIGPLTFLIDLEIIDEVVGRLELHGLWCESELHETECFYEVGDNVIQTRSSLNSPTDKQSVCSLIEEKLKFISVEKVELKDILRKANTQFLNDEDVRVLYKKYVGVFKETVLLEEEQVNVDDFHPGDGEKFGTDVAVEKQTAVEAEDVNEEVMNEAEEDKFKDETFTQWIEGNIEWFGEVIDCLYNGHYEEDLFVWPSKVHVDVHHPEIPEGRVTRSSPKKRISKSSAYLSSPYMNKKTVVIAQVKRLEFVLGNSLFAMQGYTLETIFQTSTGPDVSFVHLNMETLTPTLWIDVDCWVAILNHEEFVKVDPSPKRHFLQLTQAMIEGRIKENQQLKMFSTEISAQFQNNIAAKSLSEVELRHTRQSTRMLVNFWYLCENNHPLHDKVAKVKPRIPKLKWRTTKNHVDCGVFLMIHMKSYIGEPVARWDVGMCTKSHMQDSLLRRMRYKIDAKILLHGLNIHSQKMFDLAYKFETENDEHTRILIIVNVIQSWNN
ncbi:hypothetical protein Tco_0900714 [Tanacetum coccineum]